MKCKKCGEKVKPEDIKKGCCPACGFEWLQEGHISKDPPGKKSEAVIKILILLLLIFICLALTIAGTLFLLLKKKEPSAPLPWPTQYDEKEPVKPEMIFIEGSTFEMGKSQNKKSVYMVELSSFYIGKYEVTNEEFCRFLNATKKDEKIEEDSKYLKRHDKNTGIIYSVSDKNFKVKFDYETLPVVQISWYDAVDYCNWLSMCEGLEKCYDRDGNVDVSKKGYRLPTDAEWEFACKGTEEDKNREDFNLYDYQWDKKPWKVGISPPNSRGIYDMKVNVMEWCTDRYEENPEGSVKNPVGPSSGYIRIVRGGTVSGNIIEPTGDGRIPVEPEDARGITGFRLAKTY